MRGAAQDNEALRNPTWSVIYTDTDSLTWGRVHTQRRLYKGERCTGFFLQPLCFRVRTPARACPGLGAMHANFSCSRLGFVVTDLSRRRRSHRGLCSGFGGGTPPPESVDPRTNLIPTISTPSRTTSPTQSTTSHFLSTLSMTHSPTQRARARDSNAHHHAKWLNCLIYLRFTSVVAATAALGPVSWR